MRRAGTLLLSRAAAAASSPASANCRWLLAAGGRDATIEASWSSSAATTTTTSSSSTSSHHLLRSQQQRRSFAIPCNLKLGAVPPPPLVVHYAKGGADAFIELADELEEAVPGLMVEGREDEEGEETSGTKNDITEISAPGGKTLLSPVAGKPVLARDVLEALGKWQEEEEEEKERKKK